jgi:hypothetical protein
MALLLLPVGQALAQSPPAIPILGTVAGTLTRGANWCAVERGASAFKRSGTGPAFVTVPEITYTASGPVYYTLAGRMQLSFSAATSGTAYFDFVGNYPAGVSRPTFTGYNQTYTTATGALIVRFVLNFPGCSVSVVGSYRA